MGIENERGNYETELRIKEICAWTEDESMKLHQILSPDILNMRQKDSGRDRGETSRLSGNIQETKRPRHMAGNSK